jgi:hypothetical protein
MGQTREARVSHDVLRLWSRAYDGFSDNPVGPGPQSMVPSFPKQPGDCGGTTSDPSKSMNHQILIASYSKDFIWLGPCLASLNKFCNGFLPPVISVAPDDAEGANELVNRFYPEATVVVHCDERGKAKGNLRAQMSMMHGDRLCRAADYIWLVGSDCIVHKEFSPEPFFRDGKPVMLINTYEHLLKYVPRACIQPWQQGVEWALGFSPSYEYMRRLPLMYPRDLFIATRFAVENRHGVPFEDFVYNGSTKVFNGDRPERSDASNFSESNLLGAYAHKYTPDMFEWVDLDNQPNPIPNPMIQFWSHGGLDKECDIRFDYSGGNTFGKVPRAVITEILGANAIS